MIPELLTTTEIADAGKFVVNDAYAMQPKRDGKRLILSTVGGRGRAFNKRGEPCAAPAALLQSLPQNITIDGELEPGSRFIVFDLLDCLGHDLRQLPYSQRLASLQQAIQRGAIVLPESMRVIETWFGAGEKEKQLLQAVADRLEGVVFKKLAAPYSPGRAGQHFKLKFVKTCTVRVRSVEPTSARIEMFHQNAWTEVCGVSLIGRPKVKAGDYLEVKYLYATVVYSNNERGSPHGPGSPGGASPTGVKLVQPVMLQLRDDAGDSDCSTGQLIFKAVIQ
jgi:bifunctional non-homologous end joining protein LigD